MKKLRLIILSILLCCLISGCQRKEEPLSASSFLLNTFVTITLYDSQDQAILDQAMELCRSYENLFSKTIGASEIYKLNHRASSQQTFKISDDTAALLDRGLYYSAISDGAFDITVDPLSTLWDFNSDQPAIPDENALREAVQKVGYQKVALDGNTLTFLSPDTSLDLGAIAKGYIADRLRDYLTGAGVKSAVINLGGNVLCVGQKPDGTPFKIGLQKPFESHSETVATLNIDNMSVVSSGVYERHFIIDGKNYHHILDPKTGFPYDNGLIAVTILSPDSVDGDGLSTTCFSLGLEKGMALLDSMDGIYGIFITEDGSLHYSEGAKQFIAQ